MIKSVDEVIDKSRPSAPTRGQGGPSIHDVEGHGHGEGLVCIGSECERQAARQICVGLRDGVAESGADRRMYSLRAPAFESHGRLCHEAQLCVRQYQFKGNHKVAS